MIYRLVIFLILNFGALALGGLFTGSAVVSDWYIELNKAPWTPPGWFFGVAWTTIMICFTLYMAFLWEKVKRKNLLITLFAVQWLLNVAWNPVFFKFHLVVWGMVVMLGLIAVVGYFLFHYKKKLKWKTILILPYFIWLLIALSLNGYIWLMN